MSKLKSVSVLFCLSIFCTFVSCFTTYAATLNIDDDGNLLGAYDVMVDGTAYDVVFQEGIAEDLFYKDSEWVFTFTSYSTALLAAHALADSVFIDVTEGAFDSQPELTNGIESLKYGNMIIPYATSGTTWLSIVQFWNANSSGTDMYGSGTMRMTYDSSERDNTVWAVWTEASSVPVPGAVWLLGSGILGLMGIRIRMNN